MPGHTIGATRFLIGGDMNTGSHSLSQVLQVLREAGVLQTKEKIIEPFWAKRGDLCFLGGFAAEDLKTTANNHDPAHVPYGLEWTPSLTSGHAPKQPSIPRSGSPRTRAGLHSTAEELQQAAEPQTAQTRASSTVKVNDPALSSATKQILPEEEYATEQLTVRFGSLLDTPVLHSKAEELQPAVKPQTAQTTTSSTEEVTKPATGSATQQTMPEKEKEPLPADKMLAYSIVNEFLGKITFDNPEAEHMLLEALDDESPWIAQVQHRIAEVFEPIFFYYPHGLKNRSVWEPCDTGKYISKWRELAVLREQIDPDANAQCMRFRKEQVDEIFQLYFNEFKTTLRPDQINRNWSYKTSCFESKLRTDAGSCFLARAIWEVGLPRLPSLATEQRCRQISMQELEAIPKAIHDILNWLDSLATTLIHHRLTPEYDTAKRKSGREHWVSGLTATEHQTRAATRKAKFDMRTATRLAAQWDKRELTYQNCKNWQRTLLSTYWDGSLQERLHDLTASGNADPMCRTPSVKPLSFSP